MLAQLKPLCVQADIWFELPVEFQRHVLSAECTYSNQLRLLKQEHLYLSQLFNQLNIRWVYLKGAAYQLSGITCMRGRLMSDIDILVPQEQLKMAEQALIEHGWLHKKLTDYDDKFYREYSQEIPPLRHFERQTELDVHFNILPKILNHGPDPVALLAQARALAGGNGAQILSPEAMVLHSAIHLFHESEYHKGVRDLFDIYQLISGFSQDKRFWGNLIKLQGVIGSGECMYYAIRYCRIIYKLDIPSSVTEYYEQFKPGRLAFCFSDAAFIKVFRSIYPVHCDFSDRRYLFYLYFRGHLKRLPFSKLVPHLFKKSIVRFFSKRNENDQDMVI